jgi:hypothetical protein
MKTTKNLPLDFRIDKLTNSIENTSTGEVFDTIVVRLTSKDSGFINKSEWQFDWSKELKDKTIEVYKLYYEWGKITHSKKPQVPRLKSQKPRPTRQTSLEFEAWNLGFGT